MQNPSNSAKPLNARDLRFAIRVLRPRQRRAKPVFLSCRCRAEGAEGVETRRGAPKAMCAIRASRWRRHSPAHERLLPCVCDVADGVERRSVTKIRRLTACRFESGPRHQALLRFRSSSAMTTTRPLPTPIRPESISHQRHHGLPHDFLARRRTRAFCHKTLIADDSRAWHSARRLPGPVLRDGLKALIRRNS